MGPLDGENRDCGVTREPHLKKHWLQGRPVENRASQTVRCSLTNSAPNFKGNQGVKLPSTYSVDGVLMQEFEGARPSHREGNGTDHARTVSTLCVVAVPQSGLWINDAEQRQLLQVLVTSGPGKRDMQLTTIKRHIISHV